MPLDMIEFLIRILKDAEHLKKMGVRLVFLV